MSLVKICCYNSIPARQDIPICELVQSRGIEQRWARSPNHLCCVGFGCISKKRTSKNEGWAQKSQHIVAKIMEKRVEWSKIIYDGRKYIHYYIIYTHIYIYIHTYIRVCIFRKQLQPHTPPKHNLCGPSRLWRCGRPIVNDLRQFK